MGAKLIYPVMPNAKILIGHKGYDSVEFRDALNAPKTKPSSIQPPPSVTSASNPE